MLYRLYLDESGDHFSQDPEIIGKRYLGLVGIAVPQESYSLFRGGVDLLKRAHLAYDEDDPPILHREDIVACRGCFNALRNPEPKAAFDDDLTALLTRSSFTIFSVTVDKYHHFRATYRKLVHPYHYGLHALLERYCGFLKFTKGTGDVLAESRGKREDEALKQAVLVAYGKLSSVGEGFGQTLCDIAKKKYNKQMYSGKINGYGRIHV